MSRVKQTVGFVATTEHEGAATATLEPPAPPPVKIVAEVAPLQPCALDGETINSKIVMVRADGKKCPVLATPRGEMLLSENDVAWMLPEGARVSRDGPDRFVGIQLDHNRDDKPLVGTTARDVIARFHQHFHG